MASIERISRVSVYHLRTGAYAQTHVDEIYVYNGLQSVLFVPTHGDTYRYIQIQEKFYILFVKINRNVREHSHLSGCRGRLYL
jgi:hypothetical protein